MVHPSRAGVESKSRGFRQYVGEGNPAKMLALQRKHHHVLPLGLPVLSIMQSGRWYKGGAVSGFTKGY